MDEYRQQPPIAEAFRIMADHAPVLMWMSGVDKLCYFFNAGWLRFTGRTLEQEYGKGWTESIHPEDIDRCLSTYYGAFDTLEEFKMEYRLRRHDGVYRWVVDNGVPRYEADGKFAGYIGSCMDIDELLESERIKKEYLRNEAIHSEQLLNDELSSTNEELATMNEELAAVNEEQSSTNIALQASRESLKLLNDELEMRILQRTKDLIESEHRVMNMVESAPFPIGVYVGREMRILMANQSILEVWGKGEDVIGKCYADVLPELGNQEVFKQLAQVYDTGIPFSARNQRIDLFADGQLKVFYFNYSFTPLLNAEGAIYGVMNTAADVTDLNLAKQKVEQNESNLQNMILQAPVAMCILLGPTHVITVANQLMIELWGKTGEDIMNKPIFEALPDAAGQGLEHLMDEVYEGQSFKASEMPVSLLRNGKEEVVYQNFVYEPYKDSDGEILGIIAITIDVTEQVLARQAIEQSEAELLATKKKLELELEAGKKLQRQKDDFIGIASHELKTPLTSITAIVQLLDRKLKDFEDPFVAGAMKKANTQVKKMISLINGFLNVSRLESGKLLIEKQRFHVDELIASIIDEIQLTTTGHIISLNKCDSLAVVADRDKIGIVISNLLSNAVKYSPFGKYIEVSCSLNKNFVMVSIKDEGMGVREEDLAQLFDRYYRVETNTTKDISGFGIGLYLSAEIIRHHGGQIWAESQLGKGSTFHFTLPLD